MAHICIPFSGHFSEDPNSKKRTPSSPTFRFVLLVLLGCSRRGTSLRSEKVGRGKVQGATSPVDPAWRIISVSISGLFRG